MKNLILIRHANSAFDRPDVCDYDRPIDNQGIMEAKSLAPIYISEFPKPDQIYSSSALRTKETIAILENRNEPLITFLDKLYLADTNRIESVISEVKDKIQTISIVGHNPGITEFFNRFDNIDSMPTCSIACFELQIDKWSDIYSAKGVLTKFVSPKLR